MKDGAVIGGMHMGPIKLLRFLELHLGMTVTGSSEIERVFQYKEQLKSKSKKNFLSKLTLY